VVRTIKKFQQGKKSFFVIFKGPLYAYKQGLTLSLSKWINAAEIKKNKKSSLENNLFFIGQHPSHFTPG